MTPDPSMMAGGGPDFSLMQMAVYGFLFMLLVLGLLTLLAVLSLPVFFGALSLMNFGLRLTNAMPDPVGKWSRLAGLVFRSLRRNLLRTALTYVALFVLTGMLALIYGVVSFLGNMTADKEGAQLVLLTEKFAIPSQMPPGYARRLKDLIRDRLPKNLQPADLDKNFMTWTFVGAAIDPTKNTPENNFFLFCMDPNAIANGMMKDWGLSEEELGEKDWKRTLEMVRVMNADKRHIFIGEDRLRVMNKKVGETLKFTSNNYRELEFDCVIVGTFPSGGRLGGAAVMRYDFLQAKMDEYRQVKGKDHPLVGSSLNLVWVRMPSKEGFELLSQEVAKPDSFPDRAAKLETFSSAIGTFLEPLKDIVWGMKYIIVPAILAIMCLVVGITITISVRERRAEMAVMKVLGFQPRQVQAMVTAESVLVGVYGGLLATVTVYFLPRLIDEMLSAQDIKVAFLKMLFLPPWILLYGSFLGVIVGLVGAWMPSRTASRVKVSEVFAQVA